MVEKVFSCKLVITEEWSFAVMVGTPAYCCRNLSLHQQYKWQKKFSVASWSPPKSGALEWLVGRLVYCCRNLSLHQQYKWQKKFSVASWSSPKSGALQWWSVGQLIVAEIFHYINNINDRKKFQLQAGHYRRVDLCNSRTTSLLLQKSFTTSTI